MISYLEFEKPVAALESRIAELRAAAEGDDVDISAELQRLEEKSADLLASIYGSLTPWQKTQVARHPMRPHFRDFVAYIFDDFMPLGGDRYFGEDEAIIGGFARLGDRKVMLIGHEKGHDTESRLRHNFGMGKPEGYRKAIRLMEMADRFGLPVVTLVDTSGAFPGVEAEERGQAEAIARSTEACLALRVPMVATIVGEGGSGGAVALASAERVLMLEHAVYSVISPEGCASILWRTAAKAPEAAEAMKVTARDLLKLGVIDRIVNEPVGGAHRDPRAAANALRDAIGEELDQLEKMSPDAILRMREDRFLGIGGTGADSAAKKK
ncbi:acetyl-CoA carboxylase carboxyl transferase subunit alpha [Caenibius tardaugens NBRC 16725]|uniref:Acetyl-coenzyme A carboxylase carboxyl transferase subunit alpha n=1 Tax=Caenibius tardaugens NBRC 16725 TaxID=1219035 RepID=U2ZSR7_9SPHN|nr:acetyl-CoA carboxylase carboxyltransferase subunit alpha [Caenibius tardaugens]AZI34869.1 acetyl-CoA carboxylase carboxyltransferase subunit alpha [Caenibius tardaugens NBRC 16725]GAD48399.1 acetyl-CoA carboxylase carboxyl transferase subunit alpha [Caenibius tardaugens NBRC 16725]